MGLLVLDRPRRLRHEIGKHESTASRWNDKILAILRKSLVRYLEVQRHWKRSEVEEFFTRCLEYLAARLEAFRRRAEKTEKPCKFSGEGRPVNDEQ